MVDGFNKAKYNKKVSDLFLGLKIATEKKMNRNINIQGKYVR